MTPVEYALEIEASLNHIYESHDTLFDSIMNSDNYESFCFRCKRNTKDNRVDFFKKKGDKDE